MSTIMDRKAAEFWWNKVANKNVDIPSNVIHFFKDTPGGKWETYTWEDEHRKRTTRDKMNISNKRAHEVIKPCFVYVFSNGSWLMGGLYTQIITLKKDIYLDFRVAGISRQTTKQKLQNKLMQLFPLSFPELGYEEWKCSFVKYYKNATYGPKFKIQALVKAYCKFDSSGNLLDIDLTAQKLENEKV